MCPPDRFSVEYVINPWMDGHIGDVDRARAHGQWEALRAILEGPLRAMIATTDPIEGLPDMVFTANAGLVHDGKFVPARFRYEERRGEEKHFESWFRFSGFDKVAIEGFNEGAGDLLFGTDSESRTVLYAARGFRTDSRAHESLRKAIFVPVESLDLVDPRFYHLDTCFCPLPGGALVWYPPAFAAESVNKIQAAYSQGNRFEVSADDATRFACNAVAVPGHVVLNDCSVTLGDWLGQRGFQVHRTPLDEFMKSGGAAKCLTLRIDTGPI
jgi:N-dimethylarginine dimethylaminohydrolase